MLYFQIPFAPQNAIVKKNHNGVIPSVAALMLASASPSVLAQDDFLLELEEIVVTAQKRVENLQDVPISVSTVSGLTITEKGITNLEGVTAYVPNLTFNQTGIGTIISIRGISSGINQGFEQSVGQYMDGIYYGRAQLARAPFMDLERIEVLRGPQSILFGKNSIGGAISMITAKPTDTFEASATALYEPTHDEQDMRVVVSGPISDSLSGRLAVLNRDMGGYFENTTLDRDESAEEERVIRGTLAWHPNDSWDLVLKAEDGSFDTKGRFIDVINPTEINGGESYASVLSRLSGGEFILDTEQNYKRQSNGDFSNNETENITLSAEYYFSEHTLSLVSGYNAYEYDELCNCDFIGASIYYSDAQEEFDQWSQEIRITSPGGRQVDYIAGLFYQTSDLEFRDATTATTDTLLAALLGPHYGSVLAGASSKRTFEQTSEQWSVFAQATWNINDTNRLIVGGRFTQETKEAKRRMFNVTNDGVEQPVGSPGDDINFVFGLFGFEPYATISGKRDEPAFTPLITYQYDLAEHMLYATYVTGFKAGGFDTRSNAHPDESVQNAFNAGVDLVGVFEYEEEKSASFEIGGKFSLANGAAELNVALFNTQYEDLQVSQFSPAGFNVTNAGEATTQGLELDARWAAYPGLMLKGALAYLDFEFDSFPNTTCYFGQEPNSPTSTTLCDVSGETREFTPEIQANISGDYKYELNHDLRLRAVVDVIYSDDYFTSPTLDPRTKQSSYTKLNARLSIQATDASWEVALVGKNLTDEAVKTFSNVLPVSTTFTGGNATAYYAFYDRPRSVALQAAYRF